MTCMVSFRPTVNRGRISFSILFLGAPMIYNAKCARGKKKGWEDGLSTTMADLFINRKRFPHNPRGIARNDLFFLKFSLAELRTCLEKIREKSLFFSF
jgi:hypothetical protein